MIRIIFSILTIFLFSSCQTEQNPIDLADQLLEDMETAYNEEDLKKVAAFYTDDGRPFWQGIGNWTREATFTITTEFHDPVSVPEPSTMFLMGAGLLGLVGFRKRIN